MFAFLDDYMWKLTCKWAAWSHANKPKRWIVGRYFGKFNTFRNDRWVFGDRGSGAPQDNANRGAAGDIP